MKKSITLLFALLLFFTVGTLQAFADRAEVQTVKKGDANNDGAVNVNDIVITVNKILGTTSADFVESNADMDGDNSITVSDVVAMVNIILNGEETEPGGGDVQNPGVGS